MAKLDRGLKEALRAWEETRAASEQDASLSLTLAYEGDLGAIEALGFETHATWGQEALGVVRYADILTIAAHPSVVSMRVGEERRKDDDDLEFAMPDVHVRSTTSANTDGLWFAESASTTLTAPSGAAGGTAIVAIIDTGIDYTHPMFMQQSAPVKKTRIRAIWDQGLTPADVTECPKKTLLLSADTYGVEYDKTAIDEALAGTRTINHKDCDGHGTHCAGIAAGGTLTPITGGDRRVGAAPRADIIVVKLLDVEGPVKFKKADNSIGADVPFGTRFKDAIVWCLRKAKELGKPVAISMSLGSAREAGDGLDSDGAFVDTLFDPAAPATDSNFPNGAVLVKSAGNNGQEKRHAIVKFSAPGTTTIAVPLKLEDRRGGNNERWDFCRKVLHKPGVGATFWYRRNFDNVKFALQLPLETSPSATKLGVGTSETRGFELTAGPSPSITIHPAAAGVHRATLEHNDESAVTHPNGTSVRRHSVTLEVLPKESVGSIAYAQGVYEVHITAPQNTEVFVMGHREGWGPGIVFVTIADTLANGSARSTDITVTREFTATDPLRQRVITVGAYDDANGATAAANFHNIAPFSSRGPLRDFASPALPKVADKPDITAPGVEIFSAEGVDTDVSVVRKTPAWRAGDRFIDLSGTSMATPLVAGIVALFLDKKNTLTVQEVRTHLAFGARAGAGLTGTAHDRAFGKGMVDGRKSHGNI